MKTIGIIGISLRDFTDWFTKNDYRKNNYRKVSCDRYINEIDEEEYICLTNNYPSIVGRKFDEILDYDPVRLDLVRHLNFNGKYKLGTYEFKRGGE